MPNGGKNAPEEISIVWSAAGIVAAYWNPAIAHAHAGTMLGVKVDTIAVSAQLPEIVRDDLETDYASDDHTPPVVELGDPPDTIVIDLADVGEK